MKLRVVEPKQKRIKLHTRRPVLIFFSIVLCAIVLFILFMRFLVSPIIVKTGKSKIDEEAKLAINDAINEVMLGTVCYDDLIHIVTDGNGKISMLQANSVIINSLTQEVIKKTYTQLFEELKDPLYIPLGAFTGITALAGSGPKVAIDFMPYGNVTCKFVSEFTSCGINQTLHKIYAVVETKVNVVLPLNKLTAETNAEVLISESLIIGDIPDTYLMADSKSDLLNMVG